MRFERKYYIQGLTLAEVTLMLRFHPASFRTLHPDRQVNNVYFDSTTLSTFHQNIEGVNQRHKYRLRWYGEEVDQIADANFEIKIKHNELGSKKVIPLLEDRVYTLANLPELTHRINRLPHVPFHLQPVLLNSYKRSYYTSMDGVFRVTIDHDLRYHSLLLGPSFTRYSVKDSAIVLEIKYEEEEDNKANLITRHLPLRQGKHSKYVKGVQMTM
ncbi:polyphosphate polymerase domain-containing protein [bacterium]|nr:polyphosphate polymerase domain-containing protein [bacterium]